MQYVFASVLYLITAILSGFSIYAFFWRKDSPISFSLAAFMSSLAWYAFGYGGELLSKTLQAMFAWNIFQYVGICIMPYLWLRLTATYAQASFINRFKYKAVMIAACLVTLFGAASDPWLALRYSTYSVVEEFGFPVLTFTRGPLYVYHMGLSVAAFTVGTVLLVNSLLSSGTLYRKQLILMLAGSCIPWINYMLYIAGLTVPGIDSNPFMLFISAVCFGYAIFSAKLLDVIPVARGIVFEMIRDAVIVLDPSGRIADFNKAAALLYPGIGAPERGAPERGASERGRLSFRGGSCAGTLPFGDDILTVLSGEADGELETTIETGGLARIFSCKITMIRGFRGNAGRVLIFRDVTESARYLARLRELAAIDPLTGLYNRRFFMEQAERALAALARAGKPVSFFIADLDHFKQINDSWGHLAGDEALKSVALALKESIRAADIVARFGGEEFICLLPDTECEAASVVAERVRQRVMNIRASDFAEEEGSELPCITVSIGISGAGGEEVRGAVCSECMRDLLSRADDAMYRAKDEGRNRICIAKES